MNINLSFGIIISRIDKAFNRDWFYESAVLVGQVVPNKANAADCQSSALLFFVLPATVIRVSTTCAGRRQILGVSNAARMFTTCSRQVFTTCSRQVFTTCSRQMFTTDVRPVFTTDRIRREIVRKEVAGKFSLFKVDKVR